ncbi:hypothetical protein [Arthrobacter mobilis]|uniref:Uncharacterized protein n=1 Tax=Arthrobacter mobilis TaxID=2724944 RepID=A0A7X6HB18_9MICC|nr:hypothetical protein [Arthrobacter mobilis]NKX53340.1 hypothetical protein [Arthrobacter mobilis]
MNQQGAVYEYPLAAGLSVSFQRYLYPAAAVLDALPTSLGALPVCPAGPERILLPSPAGEAFWIGFLPTPGASADVGILAATGSGGWLDAVGGQPAGTDRPQAWLAVPPALRLPGITATGGGWLPFARQAPVPHAPSCTGLLLVLRQSREGGGRLHVALADEDEFRSVCGVPLPPPDPGAAYGGWRLP